MDANQLVKQLTQAHETHNPFEICKRLNIHVMRHQLIGVRGYYMRVEGVDIITLASHLKEWPERYVCAHELGHYLLHSGLNRIFMDSFTYMVANKFEREADAFAWNLLFSERTPFQEQTLSRQEMAECLNVPLSEVEAWLGSIGVL